MSPPSYRPARPLSWREHVELAALARSLDAVPRLRADPRRRLRRALGTVAAAVVVVLGLVVVAVLAGAGGFELTAVLLGALLFGATLRDVVRSTPPPS
ncbi:hypothetical protein [Actinomycetospora sp. TBRC 11914]|uniref:hypothetical protein n=1 Tax=Actinomycetospora sp. TBRC 11914 TaxID=2729387 RepID=UPI00145E723B|nr:hypothetical protein [Actinomycetospora sp. TBRC 11914]NMO90946.1 hypothetical protein [Actinomycetospora sp. TBRC 11914]